MVKDNLMVPSERIISRIIILRDKKVMIDSDLAKLYGIKTKALNQTVKRNMDRFPEDFMFILTKTEAKVLRSQIVTSKNEGRGGRRYQIYAFTEQGVAMLSSILRSKIAVRVNIQIIRAFVWLRYFLKDNEEIKMKLFEMEQRYDKQFQTVFEAIKLLIQEEEKPKERMGFK